MPIIIKGEIVHKELEQKTAPTPVIGKWDSLSRSFVKTEEKEKKIIEPIQVHKEVFVKQEETSVSHYHEEKHGELHKLFNKKSDYLRDILDLDSNK